MSRAFNRIRREIDYHLRTNYYSRNPSFFFFGRRKKRKTYLGDIRASTPRHCGKTSVYQHRQHQTFAIRFFLQRPAKSLGDWSLLHRHISSVQIIFHFRGTFTFSNKVMKIGIERTSSFSRFIVETIKPGYFSDVFSDQT